MLSNIYYLKALMLKLVRKMDTHLCMERHFKGERTSQNYYLIMVSILQQGIAMDILLSIVLLGERSSGTRTL